MTRKKIYFLISGILMLATVFLFIFPNNPVHGSIDCCFNECQPEDSPKCDGTWTQKCDKCDSDPYYDWCDQTNCAATGQVCLFGACSAGSGCTITCATGPGCRFSLANGAAAAGECCNTGDCYDCKAGWSWSGSTCVSVCADNDGDGYGSPAAITCAHPQLDCDDSNININPGKPEICDGADNDCDNAVDEGCVCVNGTTQPCGADTGQCQKGIKTCSGGVWGVCIGEITPTAEICDGLDNDCDGQTDEGCDNDNDDYCACGQTFAYGSDLTATCAGTNTTDATAIANTCDCKDNNAGINLAAAEICDNGLDDDCDGKIDCADTGCAADAACVSAATCSDNTQTNTCSTATGAPWYCDNTKNLIENCTACGCSGSWVCGLAGSYCCDNDCNGSCSPAGCTVDKDPDCGAGGCCGDGTCDTGENNISCPADCLASCTEDWTCTAWSACASGVQTRTCADSNNCGTTTSKPAEIQNCLIVAITDPNDGYKIAQGGMWINLQAVSLGGVEPYNYFWKDNGNPFGNNQPFQNLNPSAMAIGVHIISVQARDAFLKIANDSIIIEILPAGSLIARIQMWQTEFTRDPLAPVNFAVQASGGTAPYTFKWESDKLPLPFSAEQWPTVDVSSWALGTHKITVTVKDSAGKTATDSINIDIVEMALNVMPQEGQTFIKGENINFSAMVQGGIMPYNFQWTSSIDGGITPASDPKDNFQKNDLSVAVHTITITVTDSSATPLTATKQIHIQINPAPTLAASISSPADNSSIAQGDNISFQAAVNGGVFPYAYKWTSDKDGQLSVNKDFIKNNLSVGNHAITFTVSDASGQTAAKTVNITISAPISITANITSPNNGDNFYAGDSIIHFISAVSGGVGPYIYQWSSNISGNLSDKNDFYTIGLAQGNHTITLKITDQNNNTQTASIGIKVNPEPTFANTKNMAKYSAKESFLISHKNWQDALSLIPIAVWQGNKYPMLVYHDDGGNIDIDSTIHFMQLYGPDHLTTIGTMHAQVNPLLIGAQPTGAGLNAGNISNINASDYFSYWNAINSIVAVDYNNYETGLMAAVFASYKNAPIIFINSVNLDTYKTLINGKIIYTVGNLDADTTAYINSNAGAVINYDLKGLQLWHIQKTNTNKVIYVDAGDLNNDFVQPGPEPDSYGTNKAGVIFQLLQRLSLAAPYLAAAKNEVILFPKTQNVNDILNLLPSSKYITTMASHDKISGNVQGRIAGVSSADTFSYSARSVFYDELFNKLYPAPLYKKFYISADLSCTPSGVEDITNNIALTKAPHNPQDYPESVLSDKQFNVYYSHGNDSGWACSVFRGPTWLYMRDIPYLKLSWGSAGSCLTGAFHGAISFSYNWLRKGGIAYWGATKTILEWETTYGTTKPFDEWRADSAIDLQTLAGKVGGPYAMYGDPTLSLVYRGGTNQLPYIHLSVSKTETGGANEITINSGETAYMWCGGWDYDGNIIKWELDFEGDDVYDQVVSSNEKATHVYPASGTLKPKCRATDNGGGQAITFAIININ